MKKRFRTTKNWKTELTVKVNKVVFLVIVESFSKTRRMVSAISFPVEE